MEKKIKKILDMLTSAGYQAYLVGGYVRDTLLGISSFDVDIATNALPKEIHKIFNTTSSDYGSVNLKIDKYNIDITTFRKDLNYVNRRPSEVIYIDSLEEDLNRRDFTINAICMNNKGKVIDHLNGINDLEKRIIRIIGDPKKKIVEDPLRILRAIRLSSILDFEIEESLYKCIKENSYLVGTLSKDRIKQELTKILINKNFLKGLKLFDELGISSIIGLSYGNITYTSDAAGMYAQLKILNLPFTNIEKGNIIKIADVISGGVINNLVLYKYGLYISLTASRVLNYSTKNVIKKYNKLPIKSRKDIDISGEVLKKYGVGREISVIYSELEKEILNNRLKNKNSEIIKYLEKRK